MGQHDGNSDNMHPGQCLRHAFVITHQATEACHSGGLAFEHPVPKQNDNAPLGRRQHNHFQAHAVGGSLGCWLLTGITLIDESYLHHVTGHLLNALSQRRYLRPALFVGWLDHHCQHLPQCINDQMHRCAVALFVSIVASASPAFQRRLQRPTVHDNGTGLGYTVNHFAQQHPHVVHHLCNHLRLQPTLCLVIDDMLWRQVIEQHPPRRTRAQHIAQSVRDVAQGVVPLRCRFVCQRQGGRDKRPLLIGNITRIRFSRHIVMIHAQNLNVHNRF